MVHHHLVVAEAAFLVEVAAESARDRIDSCLFVSCRSRIVVYNEEDRRKL